MGTLKTTNIEPIADNGTVTLGSSGDTITVPTGVTVSGGISNTPAFEAIMSTSSQSISHATFTKIQVDTKILDTDTAYDNTTNYRFTVPSGKGGKYYCFGQVRGGANNSTDLRYFDTSIRLNGSNKLISENDFRDSYSRAHGINVSGILDLSAGDYLELWTYMHDNDGSGEFASGNATTFRSWFGAYRLIGV